MYDEAIELLDILVKKDPKSSNGYWQLGWEYSKKGNHEKSLENYKAQYRDLRAMMDSYSDTKFMVWTLAPLHRLDTDAQTAQRANEFVQWVKNRLPSPMYATLMPFKLPRFSWIVSASAAAWQG